MPLDHLWIQVFFLVQSFETDLYSLLLRYIRADSTLLSFADICLVKPIQGCKSVGKDAPSGSLPDEQLEAECREVLRVSYLIPGMILV